ncbi:hypothetical protein B7463_g6743, partial [Scytalidium lignicola]
MIKLDEFPELVSGPTITILVGIEEKAFILPQRLLGRHSGYFLACLREPWIEGSEGVLKLPGVKVETFEYFVSYIFSRTSPSILLLIRDPKPTSLDTSDIPRSEVMKILDIAILGQYLEMPHLDEWVSGYFGDQIISRTIDPIFNGEQFLLAVRTLPKNSPTRRQMMVSVFWQFERKKIEIRNEKQLYKWEYGKAFKEIKGFAVEFLTIVMGLIGEFHGLSGLLSDSDSDSIDYA